MALAVGCARRAPTLAAKRFPVAEAGQKHDLGFGTVGIWQMSGCGDYEAATADRR
jgi:hypothetical protein